MIASPPSEREPDAIDSEVDFDFGFDFGSSQSQVAPVPCAHERRHEAPEVVHPSTEVTPAPIGYASVPPRVSSSSATHAAVDTPRRSSSATHAAVDVHAVLLAFAGFGRPPTSIWETPGYAARVILRRHALTGELRRARRRGSLDIGVYEASLRSADDVAVRNGVLVATLLSTLFALALFAVAQVLVAP